MDDLHEIEFLDQPVPVIHPFMVDLTRVVLANHHFAMTELNRAEQEDREQLERALNAGEDSEVVSNRLSRLEDGFEQFRQAANQLALVGVLTRLHHWIRQFVGERAGPIDAGLGKQLNYLNGQLGVGPVPLEFFRDLSAVRNSIVHADSSAEWKYEGKTRKVAPRYKNVFGRVEFSETHLAEAYTKAVEQVTWYDERI
jgi:hypothetical protein